MNKLKRKVACWRAWPFIAKEYYDGREKAAFVGAYGVFENCVDYNTKVIEAHNEAELRAKVNAFIAGTYPTKNDAINAVIAELRADRRELSKKIKRLRDMRDT